YVREYTDARLIVAEGFGFEEGLFTGYDPASKTYDRQTWNFELDENGFARSDPSLQHPRCVFQLMRQHYSRYTLEQVENICGMPREKAVELWELIAQTAAPDKTMTILYALGWTQHSIGSQIIRCGAMVQLLLGNMGMPGGGVNALRGHSNIQGLTDIGLLSNLLPGYLNLPSANLQTYADYMRTRIKQPLVEGEVSYWKFYERFFVSLMKDWYGDVATAENDWCYDWLPKLSVPIYDILYAINDMTLGKMTGAFCQGFNILAAFPNKAKVFDGLSKLKYFVIMDPLKVETGEFWRNFGEYHDVDPSQIGTEVFRLPTTCFAEDDGSITNSSRWLQWHDKSAPGPGEAMTDTEILGEVMLRLKRMYQEEGGAFPDPIPELELQGAELSRGRGAGHGAQRQGTDGPGRRHRAGRSSQGRAVEGFQRTACRRQHGRRLLDLLGRLDRARQHDGPARQLGPLRHRQHHRLGLGLANEPSRALQPRFGAARRYALGTEQGLHLVGWRALDRRGRAGLPADVTAVRGRAAVHHHPEWRRALLRGRMAERRALSRALRAHGVADRPQPHEPEQPAGIQQPHRPGLRAGSRLVRFQQGL